MIMKNNDKQEINRSTQVWGIILSVVTLLAGAVRSYVQYSTKLANPAEYQVPQLELLKFVFYAVLAAVFFYITNWAAKHEVRDQYQNIWQLISIIAIFTIPLIAAEDFMSLVDSNVSTLVDSLIWAASVMGKSMGGLVAFGLIVLFFKSRSDFKKGVKNTPKSRWD